MQYRPRIRYTESQKALMWDRWQKGESLHQIAQLFDRHHPSIQGLLAASGGRKCGAHKVVFWRATVGGPPFRHLIGSKNRARIRAKLATTRDAEFIEDSIGSGRHRSHATS